MKTLQDIKDEYAREHGYGDWENLQSDTFSDGEKMESHMDEICLRAQKAALKNAAETAQIEYHNIRTGIKQYAQGLAGNGQIYTVERTSITNEQNLIQ